MGWYSNRIEKFKQTPDPYFSLSFCGRIIAGVGLGLLLAYWLRPWTGWIFIGVGILMRIPSAKFMLRK